MTPVCLFSFLFISQVLPLVSTAKCPSSFNCGKLGNFQFPFTTTKRPDCGVLAISGCDYLDPAADKSIKVQIEGQSFDVISFYYNIIVIRDKNLHNYLKSESCGAFRKNVTLPRSSPLASFEIKNNITLFRCNHSLNISPSKPFLNYPNCSDYDIFYYCPNNVSCPSVKYPKSFAECSTIQLPTREQTDTNHPFTFLTAEIHIRAQLSPNCSKCLKEEKGHCRLDNAGKFYCSKEDKKRVWKLSLGIGLPTIIIIGLLIAWHFKQKFAPKVQFQRSNTDSYSNLDVEVNSVYFSVSVFSYKELQEATNNFDDNRKLGDGGYGTVYYAKLRDGREVAVKRLYDHNYRRVQQFMNEVKILTRFHHKNLVSLYGCTSRHSHELLLVYEYVPNGTVACHLHGHLANLGLLSWPIRMKIAIETASALAYLHTSDIIHRDVKTNNILLENNYNIKVADFGLSRLFPNDVTHVSTAPQGTLGYVDPEYHQCYQLTSKSDVYSFGVVLIELISSMPPIDMTRHKDEVNLANLAMKKIRKGAIDELVDPSLGFHSNNDVKRTIALVAKLAFQCLLCKKELRPSMDEVLEVLMRIEAGKDELEDMTQACGHIHGKRNSCDVNVPRDRDQVRLLKGTKSMPSPTTVTDNWESECTTPNVSG